MIQDMSHLRVMPGNTAAAMEAYSVDFKRGIRGPIQLAENDAIHSLPISVDPLAYATSILHLLYPLQGSTTNGAQRFRSPDNRKLHMVRLFEMDGMNHDVEIYTGDIRKDANTDVCFGARDGTTVRSKSNSADLQVQIYKQHKGKAIEQGLAFDGPPFQSRVAVESLKLKLNWTTVQSLLPRFLRELIENGNNTNPFAHVATKDSLDHGHVSQVHVDVALFISSWIMIGDWHIIKNALNGAQLYIGDDAEKLEHDETGVMLPSEVVIRSTRGLQHSLDTGTEPFVKILYNEDNLKPEDNRELFRIAVNDEGVIIHQITKPDINVGILRKFSDLANGINNLINVSGTNPMVISRE